MSTMTLVVSVAKTLMEPSAPAGTIAALALMRPSSEFRVETPGRAAPVGQRVRNPSCVTGATVTLRAYAVAVAGMLHPPSRGGEKLFADPPLIGPLPPFS